ncbi:MAG: hybrid sensor histidine kinase/response regulator, partial [Polaromonas sp.]|nr:hybrid sensor histidine kinase/response regulator [Polaromonas sp.]
NGFELARLIRQEPLLSQTVLVALTGYGLAADRQRSQEAGFDYHLVKPADFNEIEKILISVCQNGGAVHRLR